MTRGAPVTLAEPAERLSRGAALQLVVGHDLVLLGWGLLFMASVIVWGFVANSELVTRVELDGPTGRVQGTVVALEQTPRSLQRVVRYRYRVGDVEHRGVSYAPAGPPPLAEGGPVSVEYLLERPHRSRALAPGVQARAFTVGPVLWAFLAFCGLAGLACVGLGIAAGVRRAQRARRARLGYARVVGLTEHARKGATSYTLRCECEDASELGSPARWEADVRVPQDDLLRMRARGEDAPAPMLYDPSEPARITLVDALEGGLRLDSWGRLVVGRSRSMWFGLTSPLALLLGTAVAALLFLESLR